MFERIKAYKNLKKHNKFLEGSRTLALMLNDGEMLRNVDDAIALNKRLKKTMWFKRGQAEKYNLETITRGL